MKTLKVYLAGRFERREELVRCAAELQEFGYETTARWLSSDDDNNDRTRYRGYAENDIVDIRSADIVIHFTDGVRGGCSPGAGGRNVEFGIAISARKTNVVVGPREHVFHYLPGIVHYETWAIARNHFKLAAKLANAEVAE